MRIRSPSNSSALGSIRCPRTRTPLTDPRSVITTVVPLAVMTAWCLLTLTSDSMMSLSALWPLPLRVGAAPPRGAGPANRGCVSFDGDRRHDGVFGVALSSLAHVHGFLAQDLLVELT